MAAPELDLISPLIYLTVVPPRWCLLFLLRRDVLLDYKLVIVLIVLYGIIVPPIRSLEVFVENIVFDEPVKRF